MSQTPSIVWLRQDLRLADNPALDAAARTQRPIIVLYVLDDATAGNWRMGAASRWWLHHSLAALGAALSKRASALVLRRGDAGVILPKLARETQANAVYWNRCYEPSAIARDAKLKDTLSRMGVEAHSFNGALLREPWTIKTKADQPFKVYTPFWRALAQMEVRAPLPAPKRIASAEHQPSSEVLADWKLLPTRPNWAKGFEPAWTPGEIGAKRALASFLERRLETYAAARNELGLSGTSLLSPHLHFGEISPIQIYAAVGDQRGGDKFLSEIGWREFSYNLLYHWPRLPEANWKPAFDHFPWRNDPEGLRAWQSGHTGYPLVDAAMRELWSTGYMHNRARMVAASFLSKHLLIDWRLGERWFWDTLVDADLANNAASWQWVAGSGADAAPYFRIFNPVAQGERFDPKGDYIRRWLPELSGLPSAFLHKPWEASPGILAGAGIQLGKDYPHPIVEHAEARRRALGAYAAIASP